MAGRTIEDEKGDKMTSDEALDTLEQAAKDALACGEFESVSIIAQQPDGSHYHIVVTDDDD
jgi:hypothetical protein